MTPATIETPTEAPETTPESPVEDFDFEEAETEFAESSDSEPSEPSEPVMPETPVTPEITPEPTKRWDACTGTWY